VESRTYAPYFSMQYWNVYHIEDTFWESKVHDCIEVLNWQRCSLYL